MDKSKIIKIIKMLKNFKSRIFLFYSSAFRKLTANSYPPATTAVWHVGRGKLKAISSSFQKLTANSRKLKANKGFAMLFSVLISSLLVAIGLSIFSLTLKELTISTSARESQVAFYAANSGMDCAIYWNFEGKFINNDMPSVSSTPCGELFGNASASNDVYKFKFYITDDQEGPCVDVVVTKSTDTVIESRGKNICGTGGRKVERGLTATIITPLPPAI